MFTHVLAGNFPNCQQHALTLVIAGAFLVWLTKISDGDRAIDSRDDLAQLDGGGVASQHVATAHPALGANQARTFESQENLFQIRLGKSGSFCDVAHRRRPGCLGMKCQGQKSPAGIVATC